LQELTAALMQIRSNIENYNPYLIQVIKEGTGKGKAKQPSLTSITFQLNRPAQYLPMNNMMAGTGRTDALLEKLVEQNSMLLSRVSALEAEENEEDEEEPQDNTIGAILNNPQVQTMLIGALGKLFTGSPAVQPAAMAGIPENATIDEVMAIVDSLMSKGVTLERLRKLNEMGEIKLKSLLLML
jgi:hypothetical protein